MHKLLRLGLDQLGRAAASVAGSLFPWQPAARLGLSYAAAIIAL